MDLGERGGISTISNVFILLPFPSGRPIICVSGEIEQIDEISSFIASRGLSREESSLSFYLLSSIYLPCALSLKESVRKDDSAIKS